MKPLLLALILNMGRWRPIAVEATFRVQNVASRPAVLCLVDTQQRQRILGNCTAEAVAEGAIGELQVKLRRPYRVCAYATNEGGVSPLSNCREMR